MNWLENKDKEYLINYKAKLQKKFDYLWDTHTIPLEMRHIGCLIIYIDGLIKNYDKKCIK